MISVTGKLMTVMTAGTLFFGAMASSAFAADRISGNGAFSDNNVSTEQRNSAELRQQNDTRFNNDVSLHQNTGNNDASFNTGGQSDISTGNASANVGISNVAGRNSADLNGSNGGFERTLGNSLISGNGARSENRVTQESTNTLDVSQDNSTTVNNHVKGHQNTGRNDNSFNTDGGSSVSTGDAHARVVLDNIAGSNQFNL